MVNQLSPKLLLSVQITCLLLFLVACVPVTGVVENKVYSVAWTETIPPGYRYDCDYDLIAGKGYECAFKMWWTPKEINHPEEFKILISDGETERWFSVDKNTFEICDIGELYPCHAP